ncbi:MAG: diguanylate cyclase domain-containing protein [Fervidobacterium sp.]
MEVLKVRSNDKIEFSKYEAEFERMFLIFTQTLLKISTERETTLKRKDFELLLKIVVDNLSFAHSGSVLFLDENGFFSYVATYNHNFELLRNVRFSKEEIEPKRFKRVYVMKSGNLDLRKELSNKIGRIDYFFNNFPNTIERIQSFVSIPIRAHRKILGFFNIDSWESEDVFEKTGFLDVASLIGDIISVTVERFDLIQSVKELKNEISKNNLIDTVTFLPNKKFLGYYLDKYISLARRSGSSLYFISLKIDNYYNLEKEIGVDILNQCVKKVGKILSKVLRKSDLLTYIGNGEFVILSISSVPPLPILDRINKQFSAFGKDFKFLDSISVGFCEYGKYSKDLDQMLFCSENSMEKFQIFKKGE